MDNKTKNVIGGGAAVGLIMAGIMTPVIFGSTQQIVFSSFGTFIGFYGTFIGVAIGGACCFIFLQLRKR